MAVGSLIDPYVALGVPTDASPATIRSSYKKLMLQCHPDKVHDEAQRAEKAAQFEAVQKAYELLSDARKRRKYDEEVARGGPREVRTGPPNGNPGTTPPGEGYANRDKEKERSERHEKRRQRQERQDREAREREKERERERERAERHHRDRERDRSRDRRPSEDPGWASADSRHSSRSYHIPPQPQYREPSDPLSSSLPRAHTYQDGIRPGSYGSAHGMPIPGPKGYGGLHRNETWAGSTTSPGYPRDPRDPYGASYSSPHSTHSTRKPSYSGSPHKSDASSTHTTIPDEPVREGYVETKTAEEVKLEEVRRKTREARGMPATPSMASSPHASPHMSSARSSHSHSHSGSYESRTGEYYMNVDQLEQEAIRQAAEKRAKQERFKAEIDEKERREREKADRRRAAKAQKEVERQQAEMAARFGRTQEQGPGSTNRKHSADPAVGGTRRRGSSNASTNGFYRPNLNPSRPASELGNPEPVGSISERIIGELKKAGKNGPLGPKSNLSSTKPELRRRNSISSPSLEKQQARMTKADIRTFFPPTGPEPSPSLNSVPRKGSVPATELGYSSPEASEKKSSPLIFEKTPVQVKAPSTPTPQSKKPATGTPKLSVEPPTPTTPSEPAKAAGWISSGLSLIGIGSAGSKDSSASSMVSETTSTSTVKGAEGSMPPPPPPASNADTATTASTTSMSGTPPNHLEQHGPNWKKYTVEIYVREDGTTQTVPIGNIPNGIPGNIMSGITNGIPIPPPPSSTTFSPAPSTTTGSPKIPSIHPRSHRDRRASNATQSSHSSNHSHSPGSQHSEPFPFPMATDPAYTYTHSPHHFMPTPSSSYSATPSSHYTPSTTSSRRQHSGSPRKEPPSVVTSDGYRAPSSSRRTHTHTELPNGMPMPGYSTPSMNRASTWGAGYSM